MIIFELYMKVLTENAIQLLENQRFTQTKFCKKYNLDISNFSVRKKNGNLSLKMIKLIYNDFDIEFNLIEELKTLVQFHLDKPHPVRGIPRDLGISYSGAKYFVNNGKGSYKFLTKMYDYNKEVRDIIDPYLVKH